MRSIATLIANHAGETLNYVTNNGNLYRVHTKNGVITTLDTEISMNPNIAREDQYVKQSDIFNKGLIQSRGLSFMRTVMGFLYSPGRLLYPMQRINARGNEQGQFVRITWDQALSTVANQMSTTISQYGKYSILSNPLQSWMGGVVGWESPSAPAERDAIRFTMGLENGAPADNPQGMLSTKLIVLWSENPVQASSAGFGYGSMYAYKLAKEAGIPIIVVDPRYSMSAQVLADQWIPIKPGTDCALALAMANVIFTENLVNQTYVSKYVDPVGLAQWKAYVLGQTAGPDGAINRTPAWAAPICGIPAATIQSFAELFANSAPVWLSVGFSKASKKPNGANINRALIGLQAITGGIGALGGSDCNYAKGCFPGFAGYSFPSMPPVPGVSLGSTAATYSTPCSERISRTILQHKCPRHSSSE